MTYIIFASNHKSTCDHMWQQRLSLFDAAAHHYAGRLGHVAGLQGQLTAHVRVLRHYSVAILGTSKAAALGERRINGWDLSRPLYPDPITGQREVSIRYRPVIRGG